MNSKVFCEPQNSLRSRVYSRMLMRYPGHNKGFQGQPNPWVTSNSQSTTTTVFPRWFKRPIPSSLFPSASTTAATTTTATAWSGIQVKQFCQVSRPYLSVQLSSQTQWLIVSHFNSNSVTYIDNVPIPLVKPLSNPGKHLSLAWIRKYT